jgi:hypothetical protein
LGTTARANGVGALHRRAKHPPTHKPSQLIRIFETFARAAGVFPS